MVATIFMLRFGKLLLYNTKCKSIYFSNKQVVIGTKKIHRHVHVGISLVIFLLNEIVVHLAK